MRTDSHGEFLEYRIYTFLINPSKWYQWVHTRYSFLKQQLTKNVFAYFQSNTYVSIIGVSYKSYLTPTRKPYLLLEVKIFFYMSDKWQLGPQKWTAVQELHQIPHKVSVSLVFLEYTTIFHKSMITWSRISC